MAQKPFNEMIRDRLIDLGFDVYIIAEGPPKFEFGLLRQDAFRIEKLNVSPKIWDTNENTDFEIIALRGTGYYNPDYAGKAFLFTGMITPYHNRSLLATVASHCRYEVADIDGDHPKTHVFGFYDPTKNPRGWFVELPFGTSPEDIYRLNLDSYERFLTQNIGTLVLSEKNWEQELDKNVILGHFEKELIKKLHQYSCEHVPKSVADKLMKIVRYVQIGDKMYVLIYFDPEKKNCTDYDVMMSLKLMDLKKLF